MPPARRDSGGDLRSVDNPLRPEGVYSIRLTKPTLAGNSAFPVEIRRGGDAGQPNVAMSSTRHHRDSRLAARLLYSQRSIAGSGTSGSILVCASIRGGGRPRCGRRYLNFAPMKTVTGAVKAEGPLTVPFYGMKCGVGPGRPRQPHLHHSRESRRHIHAQVMPEPYVLVRPRIATPSESRSRWATANCPDLTSTSRGSMVRSPFSSAWMQAAWKAQRSMRMPAHDALKDHVDSVGSNQSWAGRLKIVNAIRTASSLSPP